MFASGLLLEGRLFPFEIGSAARRPRRRRGCRHCAPYFIAKALGHGVGQVVAVTYEYGNTFVIVAGLLNLPTSATPGTSRAAANKLTRTLASCTLISCLLILFAFSSRSCSRPYCGTILARSSGSAR